MKKLLQCSASVNCQPLGDPGFAFPFLARDDDDVQSVRSSSLQPHGLQHARLPCPSLSSRVFSNSCPLGRWWHPTISSSIVPYPLAFNLSQHQSLPVSQLFASGGQSIGALASSLPNKNSGMISFRIDWFDFLAVQGTLKSLLQHHDSKASVLWCLAFFIVQLTSLHDYWKNHSFDYMEVCQQSDVSDF